MELNRSRIRGLVIDVHGQNEKQTEIEKQTDRQIDIQTARQLR